jgi:uncharacterized protein involved in high-affinity Fe2+ transport
MDRRAFLAAGGAGLAAALAGCTATGSLFETTNSREPPLVDPRPAGVYVPTHSESMGMVGAGSAGDLRVSVSYSYPHRFWTVEREDGAFVARQVDVEADDAVHLMATPFDPETGRVVPDTGLSVEVYRDGSLVTQEVIYRMLSQRMGFHYGANFPLDGDGTYEVRVSVGGASLRRTGAFEGRFADPGTARVPFEFSERERNDLPYELLPDRQGSAGALSPMEMGTGMDGGTDDDGSTDGDGSSGEGGAGGMDGMATPVGRAPALPGDSLGRGAVDDAVLVAARVDAARFGPEPYLAVSARTPYNRFVVPRMGLSARLPDAGFEGDLAPTLDPELGFHYGASVPDLAADATVEATVGSPSTVARHEGYETAFLETGTVTLERS